jgi:hypothetical protein
MLAPVRGSGREATARSKLARERFLGLVQRLVEELQGIALEKGSPQCLVYTTPPDHPQRELLYEQLLEGLDFVATAERVQTIPENLLRHVLEDFGEFALELSKRLSSLPLEETPEYLSRLLTEARHQVELVSELGPDRILLAS